MSEFSSSNSKLLINEPPLQVLPTLAKWVGLNHAIVLQQVHYWCSNPKLGQIVDGRRWIRNSWGEWRQDNFCFWSIDTIRRVFKDLQADGLILMRDNLSKHDWDQTGWVTVNYEAVNRLAGPVERLWKKGSQSARGGAQSARGEGQAATEGGQVPTLIIDNNRDSAENDDDDSPLIPSVVNAKVSERGGKLQPPAKHRLAVTLLAAYGVDMTAEMRLLLAGVGDDWVLAWILTAERAPDAKNRRGLFVRYARDGLLVSDQLLAEAKRRLEMWEDVRDLDQVDWAPWEDGAVIAGRVRRLHFNNPEWVWHEDDELLAVIYGD